MLLNGSEFGIVPNGANQFGQLPDMGQIMDRPLIQEMRKSNLAQLGMNPYAVGRVKFQPIQVGKVVFALLFQWSKESSASRPE